MPARNGNLIQHLLDEAHAKRDEIYKEQEARLQKLLEESGMTLDEFVLRFMIEEQWTQGYDEKTGLYWMNCDYRIVPRKDPDENSDHGES